MEKNEDPSCCSYRLSNKIRRHIRKLIKDDGVEEGTRNVIQEIVDIEKKGPLQYETLTKLHKYIQRADNDFGPFYIFLDQCECKPPKPRENKQLDERLKRLRLKISQENYNRMTSSVDKVVARTLDRQMDCGANEEIKMFSGSTIAVINSFLVYICTFIFCYKAVEYSLAVPNIIAQVLFGLLGSTVVACAELYFLARVI